LPNLDVTNENTRTQLLKLQTLDPAGSWCHACITSEEMGVEKPDPTMFLAACKTVDLLPEACLMVGDSLENDVLPSNKPGCQALLSREFLEDSGTPLPAGIETIQTLNELPDRL
jgi:putative hydrolase of the HAD superfamily